MNTAAAVNEVYDVIRQDFAVVQATCGQGDYLQMNIYSNRMVANSAFGGHNHYGIIGFFLKNLAIDFLKLAQNSESQNALKPFANAFIAKLSDALRPEIDMAQVWEGYFAYTESARKLFLTPAERQVYKDKKSFTAAAFSILSEELLNGGRLFDERGQVTKGFLNESERIIRNHGAEERELVFNVLIVALDRLLDYVKYECSSTGPECIKSTLLPMTKRITEWTKGTERLPYDFASEILAAILFEWRLFFVRYFELGRAVTPDERKIELPPEAKKRLGNTIAEALRKDLSPSKERKEKRR
jgi:hypothetical protein